MMKLPWSLALAALIAVCIGACDRPGPGAPRATAKNSAGDPVLNALRKHFVGRKTYGYGGIVLGCGPRWVKFYRANASFVVRNIVRDWGKTVSLATGTPTAWMSGSPTQFNASNPLRFIVDLPRAASFGTNYETGGPGGPCPALVLADWQVDRTITTSSPPPLRELANPPGRPHDVRIGESRSQVAWLFGYPTGFEPLSTIRGAARWNYNRGLLENFTIVFRNDRVAALEDHSVRLP